MQVQACTPGKGPRLVFSALDASVATEIEPAFAAAGHLVISNARNSRMDPAVPLLIPEVNADHLALIRRQRRERGWSGAIVTNPNCSTVVLAMALAPLRQFGLRSVMVTTLQAVSGAGYPGVPSLDILGNVIPAISGEEEKIESETQKILGAYADDAVSAHPVVVSAQTTRVPVIDGHTVSLSVALDAQAVARRGQRRVAVVPRAAAGARPADARQPRRSSCRMRADRPQPRLDAGKGGGMTVTVGRVRPCPVLDTKFVALGHNTIRGAAGAAVLNARADARRRMGRLMATNIRRRNGRDEVRRHVGRRCRSHRPSAVDRDGDACGPSMCPPVVVVSAMSGATDQLLELAADAQRGSDGSGRRRRSRSRPAPRAGRRAHHG